MWDTSIPVEIAINMAKEDKHLTWYEIIRNYFSERDNNGTTKEIRKFLVSPKEKVQTRKEKEEIRKFLVSPKGDNNGNK